MKKRFYVLDSWRGICASVVLFFHFPRVFHLSNWALFDSFYLFVDFFFVLSGFVITHSYQYLVKTGQDVLRLLSLRLGRIYPLHFVALIFCLVVFALVDAADSATGGLVSGAQNPVLLDCFNLREIFSDLFLLQSLHLHQSLHLNFPSWSISAEFYVYVAFALLLWAGPVATSSLMAAAALGGPALIGLAHGNMDTTYDYGFIRCLSGFACGYWVYRLAPLLRLFLVRHEKKTILAAAEAMSMALLAAFVLSAGKGPYSVLCPYVFAVLVAVFSLEGGPVSRLLQAPHFLRLGELSFSIYLMHAPLAYIGEASIKLLAAAGLMSAKEVSLVGDVMFLIFIALVLRLSAFTYEAVELRYKYLFSNLLDRSRPSNPLPPQPAAEESKRSGRPAEEPGKQ